MNLMTLRTEFANREPWLAAHPEAVATQRAILAQSFPGKTTVGLSWASGRAKLGEAKSIPICDLFTFMRDERLACFTLQYGHPDHDYAEITRENLDFHQIEGLDLTENIDGLAVLIASLDVVVTCSNTTAHLAGALGKRTILMAPGGRFVLWYWGRDGDRTPWYPSVEIHRGPPKVSWGDLAETVKKSILTT